MQVDSIIIGQAVAPPEGPSDLPRLVRQILEQVGGEIEAELVSFLARAEGMALLRLELTIAKILALAGGRIIGGLVLAMHGDGEWRSGARDVARKEASRQLRDQGWRWTVIEFLGGFRLRLRTPYLSQDLSSRPGRRRGVGQRGPGGGGVYPILASLGIRFGVSPGLASEAVKAGARESSYEVAAEVMNERGSPMSAKVIRRLTGDVGQQAVLHRLERIEAAARGERLSNEFAGVRLVIGTDGGRLQTRSTDRRGRKNKKGHRRARPEWTEPKLITAYVIDEKGKRVADERPLYDGTMGNAEMAFKLLVAELLLRGAADATALIMVADGAKWIWNRADDLAKALGMDPSKLVKVVDFYHAVEHLVAIADLHIGWSARKRKQWIRRMRHLLKRGNVRRVITEAYALAVGRKREKILTEIKYFETRIDYMNYATLRKRQIPIGSGATESAMRQVVNLRLKGAGIFWRPEAAESMLHLRAYLKAGRWMELMARVVYDRHDGEAFDSEALHYHPANRKVA